MTLILVVDDEYAIAEALEEVLGEEGYRVVTAKDGREGLVRAREERPALCVVDVMMPIMGGREMVRAMRVDGDGLAEVPVIMMSAARITLPAELRVTEVLRKPFDLDLLFAAIRRALR